VVLQCRLLFVGRNPKCFLCWVSPVVYCPASVHNISPGHCKRYREGATLALVLRARARARARARVIIGW
jgi:hypothetical protein